MRNGFLLMLALWSAVGSVRGQMPYPGLAPAYGPMPAPAPYYPPPSYPYPYYPAPYGPAYPQPAPAYYQPGWQQQVVPGPYNPYPVNPKTVTTKSSPACDACPAAECKPCEPLVCPPAPPPLNNCAQTAEHDRLFGGIQPFWVTAQKIAECFDQPPPPVAPCGYPWYGRAEVLYFWLQGQTVPNTANLNSTGSSIAVPGFTPVSLNSVIPNYNDIIAASHLGGRFTLGRWLGDEQNCGIEATVWGVYQASQPNYTSNGPTKAPTTTQIHAAADLLGIRNAEADALLKTFSGRNVVGTVSGLSSGELNLRGEFIRSPNGHVDILLGFRALDLAEVMGAMNTQDTVLVQSQNLFMGGQIGVEGELDCGRLFINGWGKFALGNNHETASAGSSSAATGTVTSFSSFSGNQGSASNNQFTGLGEAGLAAGYQIGSQVRIFASYTIIYLNNAVRPATQMGSFLGTSSPAGTFSFTSSSFWAQGVGLGLEFRF